MSRAIAIAAGLILLAAAVWMWESRSRQEPAPAQPAPATPPPQLAPPIPQPPRRPVPAPHGRNLWDGFPPGSWAMIETRATTGDKVETTREKITFLAMVGPQARLTKDPPALPDDPFLRRTGTAFEEQDQWTESDPKDEKLTIDGREFACQVREYGRQNDSRGVKNRARLWKSPGLKLPYREIQRNGPEIALLPDVVRLELEFTNDIRKSRQYLDVRVTDLEETVDIGGRKVACIVEEGRWEERRNDVASVLALKRWISDAVPGRLVRTVSEGTTNDKPTKKETQVVDFEIKPR